MFYVDIYKAVVSLAQGHNESAAIKQGTNSTSKDLQDYFSNNCSVHFNRCLLSSAYI